MQPLSQRDKRWKDIKLGTSNTTIGNYGCTITAIAMIIGTTPDVVNERMKQVGGFHKGNLVIWKKIEEAFPGIKTRRVWSYDNADVKANVKHVLVEVDGKPIGGFRHWVVYVGGQKLYDPWDGKVDPTSDYPNPLSYCVLSGEWKKKKAITTDMQKENDAVRRQRDNNHDDRMALFNELGGEGDFDRSWGITEIQQIQKRAKESVSKDKIIKGLREEVEESKSNYLELQGEVKKIKETVGETDVAVNTVETKIDGGLDKIKKIGKKVDSVVKDDPKPNIFDFILEFLKKWK